MSPRVYDTFYAYWLKFCWRVSNHSALRIGDGWVYEHGIPYMVTFINVSGHQSSKNMGVSSKKIFGLYLWIPITECTDLTPNIYERCHIGLSFCWRVSNHSTLRIEGDMLHTLLKVAQHNQALKSYTSDLRGVLNTAKKNHICQRCVKPLWVTSFRMVHIRNHRNGH